MKSKTNIHRALFFKVGLALSLGLSLLAFEWKSYDAVSLVSWETMAYDEAEEELPPITEQFRTPPPPPKAPVIQEVKNDEVVEEEDLTIFENEMIEEVPVYEEPEVIEEPEPEEVAPDYFIIVEKSASPGNFYKYLKKNLKYPDRAIRMGIEGKVFLSFIVDTDGSITDIQVVRGIGGGCDEEAIRVLQNSPNWEPAKQRGRAVRQKMTFPIHFTLQK